jgi:peptide-methionine (S)-S-oxide reductase
MAVAIAIILINWSGPLSADRLPPFGPGHEAKPRAVGSLSTPGTANSSMKGSSMKTATFGAGCFWGVEATFRRIPGVVDTAVGYAGGHTENPTYKEVCTDGTGHAEVVQVEYDESRVSYDKLLDVFWSSHDPTQVNRQGLDYGTQYRTVIFYQDDEQKAQADDSKRRLEASGRFTRPIATQIVPAGPFYRAEEYHQRYLEKRGLENCHI